MASVSLFHRPACFRTKAVPADRTASAAERIARRVLAPALAAAGGACMLNVDLDTYGVTLNVPQHFMLAAALLVMASRWVQTRKEGMAVMAGWYVGALWSLPFVWHQFFASYAGWVVMVVLAGLLALPALCAPRRRPAVGIVVAIALAAVPPLGIVGLGNPLLVAGAMFPGAGWWGLGLTLAFFGLSASEHKAAVMAQGAALAWGMAHVLAPSPAAPDNAWAATTYISGMPAKNLDEAFDRQDEAMRLATAALQQGARVIVFPEATDREWSEGQAFYWDSVTKLASAKGAQVLLGVYTQASDHTRTNGLVDLGSGRIYPATLSAPASLWRPWSDADHFPMRGRGRALIPTINGPAAHLICYEELLPWPLALQQLGTRPRWLVSAANQWFDHGWMLRPQERSVQMQARLWRLPLLRAVNYPELK